MSDQNCEICGKKLTKWNHAWGTNKCSPCAKGRSPEAKLLKEGTEYVTSPNGQKQYLKATVSDKAISLLLPGWGLIVGAMAFFIKGEKKRGATMMVYGAIIGAITLLWNIFTGTFH